MSEYKDGRKIEEKYENPLDIWIIRLAEQININLFRPLNFTPNMITTLSLIFGLSSGWFLYSRLYTVSSILFFISYILDCCDGNYARMFNMVTTFGDFYDHVSDVIKMIVVSLLIWYNEKLKKKIRIWFMIILVILFLFSNIHLGCQEQIYNKNGIDSLSILKSLCPGNSKQIIKYTRYVGVGTIILFITLFIVSIPLLENKPI